MAIRFGEPSASALISRRLLNARILTVASPAYIARHGKPRHPTKVRRFVDFVMASLNRTHAVAA